MVLRSLALITSDYSKNTALRRSVRLPAERFISSMFCSPKRPNVLGLSLNRRGIAKTIKQLLCPRIFQILLFSVLVISQTSCMQMPSHSDIRGDRFGNEALFVKRVHILACLEAEFSQSVGKPLSESLMRQFQQEGMESTIDIQERNPLALGGDVDFQKVTKFSPDAIVLIRLGETYSSSSGQLDLTVTFDILDAQARGIWRGSVHLYRINEMHETSESIAAKVVSNLFSNGVLALKGSK